MLSILSRLIQTEREKKEVNENKTTLCTGKYKDRKKRHIRKKMCVCVCVYIYI